MELNGSCSFIAVQHTQWVWLLRLTLLVSEPSVIRDDILFSGAIG